MSEACKPTAGIEPVDYRGDLPVYTGRAAYKMLFRLYGIPNHFPEEGAGPFGRGLSLFVDDDRDGKPMAFWDPKAPDPPDRSPPIREPKP